MHESLEAWDTPFSGFKFPSVSLASSNDGCVDRVQVESAELKYIVHFRSLVSLQYTDESLFPTTHFNSLPRNRASCCFIWKRSRWCNDFTESLGIIRATLGSRDLRHYIILDGDLIVESLCVEEPAIEPA